MELRTYWKVLTRRWWLVVAPVLVVLAQTVVTYRPPTMTYQVVMRFAAGTQAVGLSEDYDRYYPWVTSEYIAKNLADVAETGVFAQAVASRLAKTGHQVPPGTIQSAIVTDSAKSIFVVYLTWPDADQIIAVAEAITAELTENGAAYFPQLKGVEPATRPVDVPTPVQLFPKSSPQDYRAPGLCFYHKEASTSWTWECLLSSGGPLHRLQDAITRNRLPQVPTVLAS